MVAAVAGAYLLGSIPAGVLAARRAGVDVRRAGSGNIGATNVARTAGWRLGIVTLGADVFKGALPVLIAESLGLEMAVVSAAGLAAVLGHLFPVFGGFRGGKGVATALGVLLVLASQMALGAVAVFLVAVSATRIVSVGSLSAAAVLPLGLVALGYPRVIVGAGTVIGVLVIWRHADNISRLRAGTEPRLPW